MDMPWYIAKRPEMGLDAETVRQFERLFAEAVEPATGAEISYELAEPRWKFLCYLCDEKDVVLHGSGSGEIEELEPRQPLDEGSSAARRQFSRHQTGCGRCTSRSQTGSLGEV